MAKEYGVKKAVVRTCKEAQKVESFFEYILVLADNTTCENEKIRYTINDIKSIKEFPKGTKVELKVDTGMHRNGIAMDELEAAFLKIKEAELEDFDSILDIGPVVAKSIYKWFCDKDNLKFLEKLQKFVKTQNTSSNPQNLKLGGKTFVLTGSLESVTRERAKAKIRALGGDVSGSVSSKTDFLVVGSEPGSKAGRAEKLGVRIIDEKTFLKML